MNDTPKAFTKEELRSIENDSLKAAGRTQALKDILKDGFATIKETHPAKVEEFHGIEVGSAIVKPMKDELPQKKEVSEDLLKAFDLISQEESSHSEAPTQTQDHTSLSL